ncbi:hypothetical protein DLH72_01200 [Candidatus Gracilibacteria bacterium]|nr:MAG: hypothetical protein DLH72_01200 [Candidatus Gracilibacteria bacterium]
MKIKEKIAQNNEYIALLPAGQFRDELIAENEELYKKLKELGVKKIKRKKGKIFFHFNFKKISDFSESEQDYFTNLGCEINRNKF